MWRLEELKGWLDHMGKWKKGMITLGFFGGFLLIIFNFGVAAKNHFELDGRVLALEIDKRVEWLEEQDSACSKEEKIENKGGDEQSDTRKRNCKRWRRELEDKYKKLKELQT
jgi:hypothetical protein